MMAGFVNVKLSQFFDRKGVQSKMQKKEARVLSGTGAFGRTVVRRSIRAGGKKKAISDPGSPPRYHTKGSASLKDGIFFGYEPKRASVVIGPRLLNARGSGKFNSVRYRLVGVKSIPELLEKGGTRIVTGRGRGRSATTLPKPMRQTYKPRPFVGEGTKSFELTKNKLRTLMKTTKL